jgi:hypothetical protein
MPLPPEAYNANIVTKQIVEYIRAIGGYARRINVYGVRNRKQDNKGHPDTDCLYKGRGFKVEVKDINEKLTDSQIQYIAEYEMAGGKVFVARGYNGLDNFINEFKKWRGIHGIK